MLNNEGNKANNRLKTIVDSTLIVNFAAILQNKVRDDTENRIWEFLFY